MRGARPFLLSCLFGLVCLNAATPADDAVKHAEETLRDEGIGTDDPALLAFVRRHTVTSADEDEVRRLIDQLGAERFKTRERATVQLASLGTRAVPLLRTALKNTDLEIARRAERCLEKIEAGASEALLVSAARLLAVRQPAGVDRVLLDYLEGAEKDYLIEAALNALVKVGVKDGKPSAALLEALVQRDPDRRAAAAVALVRGGDDLRPAARRLLDDNDPTVRLRVGLALVHAGERDALSTLIPLLEELPTAQTGLIEDVLYRLAGDDAPKAMRDRKQYRAAWDNWFAARGATLELTKLAEPPTGHTLAVLLDVGKIVDLDETKKVSWAVEGLKFPLDAQILPGKKVLVAEYEGEIVTERDSTGKILWEYRIGGPLCAQRLANGNTFIATPGPLVEVDRAGKEVWKHTPPGSARVMKAQRLRNGNVAMIVLDGTARFREIGRDGKEVRSFAVDQRTSGGRVEVLPDGHVLVAEKDANRIVELDYQGKPVWEARFEQPVAAVRLANGNTLVTSLGQFRAVELDHSGREVWEYRTDTRVTRAWRY